MKTGGGLPVMTVPRNEFLDKAEAQGIENSHDAAAVAFQADSKKYGKEQNSAESPSKKKTSQ